MIGTGFALAPLHCRRRLGASCKVCCIPMCVHASLSVLLLRSCCVAGQTCYYYPCVVCIAALCCFWGIAPCRWHGAMLCARAKAVVAQGKDGSRFQLLWIMFWLRRGGFCMDVVGQVQCCSGSWRLLGLPRLQLMGVRGCGCQLLGLQLACRSICLACRLLQAYTPTYFRGLGMLWCALYVKSCHVAASRGDYHCVMLVLRPDRLANLRRVCRLTQHMAACCTTLYTMLTGC
jgi:hypothetical protein